jgi:hypothetical protein
MHVQMAHMVADSQDVHLFGARPLEGPRPAGECPTHRDGLGVGEVSKPRRVTTRCHEQIAREHIRGRFHDRRVEHADLIVVLQRATRDRHFAAHFATNQTPLVHEGSLPRPAHPCLLTVPRRRTRRDNAQQPPQPYQNPHLATDWVSCNVTLGAVDRSYCGSGPEHLDVLVMPMSGCSPRDDHNFVILLWRPTATGRTHIHVARAPEAFAHAGAIGDADGERAKLTPRRVGVPHVARRTPVRARPACWPGRPRTVGSA